MDRDIFDKLASDAVSEFDGWICPLGSSASESDLLEVRGDIAKVFRKAFRDGVLRAPAPLTGQGDEGAEAVKELALAEECLETAEFIVRGGDKDGALKVLREGIKRAQDFLSRPPAPSAPIFPWPWQENKAPVPSASEAGKPCEECAKLKARLSAFMQGMEPLMKWAKERGYVGELTPAPASQKSSDADAYALSASLLGKHGFSKAAEFLYAWANNGAHYCEPSVSGGDDTPAPQKPSHTHYPCGHRRSGAGWVDHSCQECPPAPQKPEGEEIIE